MSLIVRLGCVSALAAGGCVPVAFGAFSGEKDKWGEFVFEKNSETGGAKVGLQYYFAPKETLIFQYS